MDGPEPIAHNIWNALLTLLGGLIVMFVKRTADTVRDKVDRSELLNLRDEIRDWKENQERQHTENRARLDQILLSLGIRKAP
jgi:hypothetical protein